MALERAFAKAGGLLIETVFKQGIGFEPAKPIASVSGRVALW